MADQQRLMKVLDDLAAGFNSHDIDAIMALFAEECSLDCHAVQTRTAAARSVTTRFGAAS